MSVSDDIYKLNQEAWDLCFRDPSKALPVATQAYKLAEVVLDLPGLAYSLRNSGVAYWYLGNYMIALKTLEQAYGLFVELKDRQGESSTLNWLGNSYWRINDYQNSLKYHLQAMNLRRELGDETGHAGSLNNIGLNYYDLGQYDMALEYALQSLKLYEFINDPGGQATAMNNLANIYEKLGDDEKCLEFHLRSLKLKQETGRRVDEAGSLTNIGSVYRRMKLYDRAVDYHTQGYRVAKELNNQSASAIALLNLANLHEDMGQYEDALHDLEESLIIFQELGDKYYQIEAWVNLGRVLQRLGRDDDALVGLRVSLQLANELKVFDLLYHNHQALSECYEKAGDIASALSHLKESAKYHEAIFGAESERKIKNLVIKSEIEKSQQDAEIYRLKNVELARMYQELQLVDMQKTELLEQLRLKSEELERLSFEDGLTGIHNRRYLDARLQDEFIRSRRLDHDLTVIVIDIDNFKSINDRFTHDTGDKVLRIAAQLLRQHVREIDVVARYGGEEFVIVLVETDFEKALAACERIRQEFIAHPWMTLHPDLDIVTISQGFCSEREAVSVTAMIESADQRLYRAKRNGKNRVYGTDE